MRLVYRLSFTFLAGAALLAACRSQSASNRPAPGEILQWSGQYGGGVSAETRMARSEGEWISLWKQLGREPPRTLDFSREMAVAIFAGERRTGGYSLSVADARAEDGRFLVIYSEETPAPGAVTTQALTSPWVVAVVPRSDRPVVAQKMGSATQSRAQK